MARTVAEMQQAFSSVVKKIEKNKNVLALFAFGSILSGDVWEESDIDLFLVYNNDYKTIRHLHSYVNNMPVHTKILCKESFMELYNSSGKKGYILNLLCNSKLVFSRDEDIKTLYNNARYTSNEGEEINNLIYLGSLLKDFGVCKKYLYTGNLITSYEILIRTLDSFSRLYLNTNGYTVTKDALSMASNLDDDFKEVLSILLNERIKEDNIKNTLQFIEMFLERNINIICRPLLEFLRSKDGELSSFDIMNNPKFKDFSIGMENILKSLEKRGIIYRKNRLFLDNENISILVENVYSIRK